MGNHAREKTWKRDRYRMAMGPRAITASSGLAPWSMAMNLGSMEKYPTALGGSRGLAPSCCLPLWGREGSPSQFPRQLKKPERFTMKDPRLFIMA